MNAQTDQQLLRAYAGSHSEAAFAELVRRHIDLVYSAALRMVLDSHQAQDVTQGVFMVLAQNAGQLMHHPVLSGWLHRTTQHLAANAVRANVRRQTREQEAAAMNELLSTESQASWEHIAPHLDTALGELSEPDRDALLLRFFERKSAHEMAQTLGISDEAAQKRVSRAVERLREFFAKRGVTVGASGLVVVISANAVQAAPVGLAVTISTTAVLMGTTVATTTTATAAKAIAMTTLQKSLFTATVAVLAGAGIYETRQAFQLRDQVQALQQRQTALAEQISQLQRERDDATSRLAGLLSENGRLKANPNATDLLRLRGEVTRLQTAARELVQSQAGSNAMSDDMLEATADAWAKRANSVKQWFEQNPDKSIPELKLLTDADWLFEASRNLQVFTDRSQGNDFHMIADSLRHKAKSRFAVLLGHAFGNYVAVNAGYLPDGLPQLLPYFAPAGDVSPFARSVDPAILQRYELLHTGKISDVPQGVPIVREKAPVDDVIDAVLSITVGGYSMQSTGKVKDMMRQGEPISWSSEDVEKIKPFLK